MTGEADAAVAWSAIAEPGDVQAAWLVAMLGHAGALAWVTHARDDRGAALAALTAEPWRIEKVMAAHGRWAPRLVGSRPEALRERAARVGARVLARGEPGWPSALAGVPLGEPHALWIRGDVDLDAAWGGSIAIVGARAATAYGEHIAAEIAAIAADRGFAVISGGAFGIDAAAHRGALAAGGETLAVLAGGVDHLYPAGNSMLLARVIDAGAVVSEVPPGFAPHRSRFLTRNRLIAAARATVVVEAGVRSGALSTARHAGEMARPVGAVPGPLTSASSAGCHRLVRDGEATLLARPADALELALPIGQEAEPEVAPGGPDFGSAHERQAYGAIPPRGAPADAVGLAAGLAPKELAAALRGLRGRGLARVSRGIWTRVAEGDRPDKKDNLLQTRSES
ncbi:DNA-processing protein DprA [Demequina mangrovi]|uniref:DNA protecting protein DprA n=1 Tax=Demequina mangrovi TaxID=1043493 RepID=A0A1H6Z9E9_9MICO|nr:DNA-processing protein DprA [Demequina mangrovi]SEJ49356.1 DNA protecting protein DprA [Demequina mangrovi]